MDPKVNTESTTLELASHGELNDLKKVGTHFEIATVKMRPPQGRFAVSEWKDGFTEQMSRGAQP